MAAPEGIVPQPAPAIRRGVVKQVLSGDAIVLQGPVTSGPPPEVTVYLSSVSAPRLAKRPTDSASGTPDEPFAWQAREWLREKVLGETVNFVKDFTATSNREHGRVYIGGTSIETATNITELGVSEGWLEVRAGKIADEYVSNLLSLQESAKAAKKGRWGDSADAIRDIKWTVIDPRALVDQHKQKPVDAVIEQVRDGSTFRMFLLPSFDYITLQLSGVRSPSTRIQDGTVEAFAEEARFFVEQRLLQRKVQVILESVSNQNFVGSVLHPKGNIAESLLREGFAKCVDWSIGLATGGAEKLRAAESAAKEARRRLWRNYTPAAGGSAEKKKFDARVNEVVLSDQLIVEKDNGEEIRIYLSSVRLPREGDSKPPVGRKFLPLYDIPFMFEAREYLRKKLIHKKVTVILDYVQPKSEQYPEKTCCTVLLAGKNVAIGLLERGLSKVVRHRNDDENRSSQYDALLAAEATAEKEKKGLYAEKTAESTHTQRVQELQGDAQRSKQFLPYLQRGTSKPEAVVEYITSGSRLRVFVPKETCLITFLLSGINCPKSARQGPGGVPGSGGEPFADEALKFTRRACMQKEVELEVEGLDKTGAFIGYLWVRSEEGGKQNLSELLLEQGLAALHFTAEKSSHYNRLQAAETRAKNAKKNIWSTWTDTEAAEKEEEQANQRAERTVSYKKVAITDVQKGFKFAAQFVEDGPKLEKLMGELRSALRAHPPVGGAYTPRRGDLCAAPFSADGQWYRAKVESIRQGQAEVLFIDYGNRETIDASKLAALPGGFAAPAGAREYHLALAQVPNDPDYASAAHTALSDLLSDPVAQVELNVEYRLAGAEYAQLLIEAGGKKNDVAKLLIEGGFALVEKRREHKLQKLVEEYTAAEQKARKERANIWEFGDFTGNEI